MFETRTAQKRAGRASYIFFAIVLAAICAGCVYVLYKIATAPPSLPPDPEQKYRENFEKIVRRADSAVYTHKKVSTYLEKRGAELSAAERKEILDEIRKARQQLIEGPIKELEKLESDYKVEFKIQSSEFLVRVKEKLDDLAHLGQNLFDIIQKLRVG